MLIALTPDLPITMIGATGGVAGVVGAHAVSWPRSRLTPLELPALGLAATWVLTQVAAAGADASQPVAGAGGDIAYLASLAGLMVGTVLAVTAFTSPAADAALTTLPSSTAPRSRT